MPSTSPWCHEDGDEASIKLVADVFKEPALLKLLLSVAMKYESVDMHNGIVMNELVQGVPLLSGLLAIDPRGGYFTQVHMLLAIQQALEATASTADFIKMAPDDNTYEGSCEIVSYKTRVMLSHVRTAYDTCVDKETHELKYLFEIMDNAPKKGPMSATKARRLKRLAARPNPFICFRKDDENEEELIEDELKCIAKQFDGKQAIAIFSDGSQFTADQYVPGPDGFVIAKWLHDGSEQNLEVPNNYLVNGGLTEPCAVQKPKPAGNKDQHARATRRINPMQHRHRI